MGLIKNALTQGLQVAARVGDALGPAGRRGPETARLSTWPSSAPGRRVSPRRSARRAAGLSYALLEQDTVGGAVAHYPRQKVVMTEAVEPAISREVRPAAHGQGGSARRRWSRSSPTRAIQIHERTKVTGIDGQTDDFLVTTVARRPAGAAGGPGDRPSRHARERMGVPGEDCRRLTYRLIDPTAVRGQARAGRGGRRLRAGGGDPAGGRVERRSRSPIGAPSSAGAGRSTREKLEALRARGRVRALHVDGGRGGGAGDGAPQDRRSPGDSRTTSCIACLGGELPTEFLKSVGVAIRRHNGDKAMANPALAGALRQRRAVVAGASGLVGSPSCCLRRARRRGLRLLPAAARAPIPRPAARAAEAVGRLGSRCRHPGDAVDAARTSSTPFASG